MRWRVTHKVPWGVRAPLQGPGASRSHPPALRVERPRRCWAALLSLPVGGQSLQLTGRARRCRGFALGLLGPRRLQRR
jgi:hypothetical protein